MSVAGLKISKNVRYAVISVGCLILAFNFVEFGALQETLLSVRPSTMVLSTLLVLASVLFALVRFRSVLKSFGYLPSWRDTFIAFSFGQASNLIFFNVIGQSLSRAAVLSQAKVPAGVSVLVTYWERGLAAAILFLFSMAGGWYLFATGILNLQAAAAYLVYVFGSLTLVVAIVTAAILGPALALARAKYWAATAVRMWPSVVLTVLSQICMLSAYFVVLIQIGDVPLSIAIVSAITVVMFAASLPISFSGWGVRELSSVQVFGAIGVGSTYSVTTSITIGLVSLVVLIFFAVLGIWLFVRRQESAAPAAIEPKLLGVGDIEWTRFTALLIAISTSVLIFFQVRITTEGGAVTANVSDVVALTAFGLTILLILRHRNLSIFPPFFSIGLLAISGLFVLALAIGWSRYGLTQWAVVNRGFGWVIILGYLAAGGVLVWTSKTSERVLVLWCFALAGASIAGIELVLLIISLFKVSFPADTFVYPLRGYSGNSNAFALQMVLSAVAAITAYRLGSGNRAMLRIILVVTALAAFYSLSRSGMATYLGAVFLFVIISSHGEHRERLFNFFTVAVATLIALTFPDIASKISALWAQANLTANPNVDVGGSVLDKDVLAHLNFVFARVSSDTLRWQSIADGWALWKQYPLFGAGLGAFVQSRIDAGLSSLVIHSGPVWIMAELGLFGIVVIGAVFVGLLGLSVKMIRDTEYFIWGSGLIVLLAAFAVSGSVHDFFYQRSFWFLLGVFVAVCGKSSLQLSNPSETAIESLSPAIPLEKREPSDVRG